jgi:hypothetical protein
MRGEMGGAQRTGKKYKCIQNFIRKVETLAQMGG